MRWLFSRHWSLVDERLLAAHEGMEFQPLGLREALARRLTLVTNLPERHPLSASVSAQAGLDLLGQGWEGFTLRVHHPDFGLPASAVLARTSPTGRTAPAAAVGQTTSSVRVWRSDSGWSVVPEGPLMRVAMRALRVRSGSAARAWIPHVEANAVQAVEFATAGALLRAVLADPFGVGLLNAGLLSELARWVPALADVVSGCSAATVTGWAHSRDGAIADSLRVLDALGPACAMPLPTVESCRAHSGTGVRELPLVSRVRDVSDIEHLSERAMQREFAAWDAEFGTSEGDRQEQAGQCGPVRPSVHEAGGLPDRWRLVHTFQPPSLQGAVAFHLSRTPHGWALLTSDGYACQWHAARLQHACRTLGDLAANVVMFMTATPALRELQTEMVGLLDACLSREEVAAYQMLRAFDLHTRFDERFFSPDFEFLPSVWSAHRTRGLSISGLGEERDGLMGRGSLHTCSVGRAIP